MRRILGSPPHVRGKGGFPRLAVLHPGITPACAGKSALRQRLPVAVEDHPRMCGEKAYSKVIAGSLWGSPPHVRGKEGLACWQALQQGITPACAGKSITPFSVLKLPRDHPRMCGEKMCCSAIACRKSGSPPHVRGKELTAPHSTHSYRITPACAGKSFAPLAVWFVFGDHPRMCGEKAPRGGRLEKWAGSPPHVRGKEVPAGMDRDLARITPACAGKSNYCYIEETHT